MSQKYILSWGRGGGQVVSVLAFYSDGPSSNPQKEAGVVPFKNIFCHDIFLDKLGW